MFGRYFKFDAGRSVGRGKGGGGGSFCLLKLKTDLGSILHKLQPEFGANNAENCK